MTGTHIENARLLADTIYSMRDAVHAYRLANEADFQRFLEAENARTVAKASAEVSNTIKRRKSKKAS